jgi:hypothetical protein
MKPSYTIEAITPYLNIENYLGENEAEDPYYFGYAFIQQIKNSKLHELIHIPIVITTVWNRDKLFHNLKMKKLPLSLLKRMI